MTTRSNSRRLLHMEHLKILVDFTLEYAKDVKIKAEAVFVKRYKKEEMYSQQRFPTKILNGIKKSLYER